MIEKIVFIVTLCVISANARSVSAPCYVEDEYNIVCTGKNFRPGHVLEVAGQYTPVRDRVALRLNDCTGVIDPTSFPNLRVFSSLYINNCNFDVFQLPYLPRLTYLRLNHSSFPNMTIEALANAPNVVAMDVFSEPYQIYYPGWLSALHRAKHISLHGIKFPYVGVSGYTEGLYSLESLAINDNNIYAIQKACLDNVLALRELDFSFTPLSVIEPGSFDNLQHLERLILLGTNIVNFDVDLLAHSSELVELGLPVAALRTIDFNRLRRYCPKLTTITILDTERNNPDVLAIMSRLGEDISVVFKNHSVLEADLIKDFIREEVNELEHLMGGSVGVFLNSIGVTMDAMNAVAQAVGNGAGEFANAVGSTFGNMAQGAGQSAGNAANAAGSTFGNMAQGAHETMGSVGQGIGSFINGAAGHLGFHL